MLTNITTAFTTVLGWMSTVVTEITTGDLSDLGVLFGIGIGMAIIGGAIALIKKIIWGA